MTTFTRNRFTIAAYTLLGFYAYTQLSLGPIMPFVRESLSLNYTVTGLHSTAFALGMVIAGASGAPVAKLVGRRRLFWGGGLGMCLGSVLFMIAPIAPLTITGTFLMGWMGSYLIVMIQSTLADEHLEHSAIALTEANIVAILFGMFVPILVGIGASTSITWRLGLIVPIIVWVLVFGLNRQTPFPKPQVSDTSDSSTQRLPRLFWLYWIVIFLGVAVEWAVFFWSADFLDTVVQLPTEQASAVTSTFLLAMLIGRFVGSRLTYHYLPRNLFWLAIALVAVGFPLFWVGGQPIIHIIGLFVMGLGVANLFPFGLAIASRVGGQASDLASSRVSLAAGLAILILPQLLGSTADAIGIFKAFLIVPIFLLLLLLMLWYANRQDDEKSSILLQ